MDAEVERLLSDLGLQQYGTSFAENAIDAETLADLTEDDLRELGVMALGHRKKILKAIAERRPETSGGGAENPQEARSKGQKRQLTLMFADIAGSTELSQSLGLEAYRDLLRRYHQIAEQAIEAQGGYVAKYLGDGVLAYFGYPQAHEDDGLRCVRAGIAMISKAAEQNPPISIRIGVETGPVVVGDILGDAASRELAVVGSTANLAARLQGVANPGDMVIGPTTQRLLAHLIETDELGEQRLKGFSEPVAVWRVKAIQQTAADGAAWDGRRQGDLIGRQEELAALHQSLSRMRAGEPVAVDVVGEPGIGKSRLVSEFLSVASRQAAVFSGNCAAHGGSTAFFPFLDLLRRRYVPAGPPGKGELEALVKRLRQEGLDGDTHLPYLLRLLDIDHPSKSLVQPDLIGKRTEEAISRLLLEQARVGPTILFVNDLHWIDERSSALLDGLLRMPERQGLMILTTARRRFVPAWKDLESVTRIILEPLTREEGLAFLSSRLAGATGAEEATLAAILERAGGNPLFLEELTRHLHDTQAGKEEGRQVPETLPGLLMQRVDSLPPGARNLAEAAAVAGRRFELALILGEEDAHGDALRQLENARLLYREEGGGNTYRFHHALIQDVIYESLLDAEKKALHATVGKRMKELYKGRETEAAEDLARHFEAAGQAEEAARHAFAAGQKALELFALTDAETWFAKCVALLPGDSDADGDVMRAGCIVNLSQVRCWNGDFPGMVQLAQSHLPRIQALGDVEEVAYALNWIGEGFMHVGRFAEARSWLERAAAIAEQLGDRRSGGYARGELLWLDSISGNAGTAEDFSARCADLRALGRELGENYLVLLGSYPLWADATLRGEINRARNAAQDLIDFGVRSGYPPATCWGYCILADSEMHAGNLREAEEAALAGRAAAACNFDHLVADLCLGMILCGVGKRDQGLEILSRAPWRSERIGSFLFAYTADIAYGRALMEDGRRDEGREWLRQGRQHFESMGNRSAACLAALALAEAEDALEGDDSGNSGGGRRLLSRLFGKAGGNEGRISGLLDYLRDNAPGLDMRGWLARALLLEARRALKAGNREAAARHIQQAADAAGNLGWLSLEQAVNGVKRHLSETP